MAAEDDARRGPVGKPLGADIDVVGGSRLDIVKFKESVVIRHHRAEIGGRAFENDSGARNSVVIHIGEQRGLNAT